MAFKKVAEFFPFPDDTNTKASLLYDKNDNVLKGIITHRGQVNRTVVLDLSGLNKKVLSRLNNLVGWSFSDIQKAAKRITLKVGVKKLALRINTIIKDPRFAKGMALASTIYPPLGIAYVAVRASAKLIEKVHAGDEDAQMRLMELAELAKDGNKKAIVTVRALSTLHQMKKKGVNISGWADKLGPWVYSKSYRTNLEAKSFDRSNPFHIMRGLYNAGIDTLPGRR